MEDTYIYHYGVKGQKWGVRRQQKRMNKARKAVAKYGSKQGAIAVTKYKNKRQRIGQKAAAFMMAARGMTYAGILTKATSTIATGQAYIGGLSGATLASAASSSALILGGTALGVGAIGVGAAVVGAKTKSNKLTKKNQRFIDDIKKV